MSARLPLQNPALTMRTALLVLAAELGACSPREPAATQNRASEGHAAFRSRAQSAKPKTKKVFDAGAPSDAGTSDPGDVEAGTDAMAGLAPEAREEPNLFGPDGGPLPQTEERPSSTAARFRARMQRLFHAIQTDDPASAYTCFFPLSAYEQVKDIAKPERDYRYRLLKAFDRGIHEYHRTLGAYPEKTAFVGVDVPDAQALWMKPGSEGNKLGYYRVLRSSIRYATRTKTTHELELTSLISWRGEWYVVHLAGFK
jgi:hypothetical protein